MRDVQVRSKMMTTKRVAMDKLEHGKTLVRCFFRPMLSQYLGDFRRFLGDFPWILC